MARASHRTCFRKVSARAKAIFAFGGWILSTLLVPLSPAQTVAPPDPSEGPAGVNNAALPASDSAAPAAGAEGTEGSSTIPTPASSCCPPLPAPQAAPPAPDAAATEAAAAAAAATTGGEAGALAGAAEEAPAAAQSFLRSPGLAPVPANRRMAPPSPPSAAAVADKQNWKAIDAAKVRVIAVGEEHLDPVMMQKESKFLESAYTHGFRNLVVEYPAAKQATLDRYLNDPSYSNMAEVFLGYEPHIKNANQRANKLSQYAQSLQTVDQTSTRSLQSAGIPKEIIAGNQAILQQTRLWLAAHQMGYHVVAADLERNVGLDQSTGRVVANPTIQQAENYLGSAHGMEDRNELIAAITATVAAHARTISIGGAAHTGFLPNERVTTTSPPSENYPGLNYLLGNKYGVPSVVLAQSQISRQGYWSEMGAGYFHKGQISFVEKNRQNAANVGQDPFRVTIDSGKSIENYLREAVERDRGMAVPPGP